MLTILPFSGHLAGITVRSTGTPPPAPGLPDECLTYQQRYKQEYHHNLPHRSDAPLPSLDCSVSCLLPAPGLMHLLGGS